MSSAVPTDLLALTAELVDVPSESHHEAALADLCERRLTALDHLEVHRVGDNVVARTMLGRPRRVILAGHTDTVPADGNDRARVEGDTLWGLGSADMKGGLAVMLALAEQRPDPPMDLTYVFYAREEVAAVHSGLGELERERPDLLDGDVAVLGEPTGGELEAGCQGVLRLRVTLHGARAHTARPWMGRNALHRLGPLLGALADHEPRRPEIHGCRFHESLLAVGAEAGVAGNVVPDRATVQIAHRFAPDRTAEQAEAYVREVLAAHLEAEDELEVTEVSPAAVPAVDHPFVAGMIRRRNLQVRAKLGWTDVARFSARGVPAVNFGPGDATLAHTAGERLERSAVEAVHAALVEAIDLGVP